MYTSDMFNFSAPALSGAMFPAFSGIDAQSLLFDEGIDWSKLAMNQGLGFQGAAPTGLFGKIGGLAGLGQIAQGLASLGSVYSAFKGLDLAKDQLKFTKRAFNENLANSKQAYNTSLEDRIRARYNTEGRPASSVQSYLDKHSL